jgi:hypothetical protein
MAIDDYTLYHSTVSISVLASLSVLPIIVDTPISCLSNDRYTEIDLMIIKINHGLYVKILKSVLRLFIQ